MRPTLHLTDGPGLLGRLDKAAALVMRHLVAAAGTMGFQTYLVGGVVRDLLLGLPSLDLDVAIEGNAIRLAEYVSRDFPRRVVTHSAFGTATLHLEGMVLDLATTRTERYSHPGALPLTQPATIRDDLLRRDFPINAMALSLQDPGQGLLDPTGGLDDLQKGVVRVIHEQSFRDDPTRILRAVRYQQRLGFSLDPGTEALARRDGALLQQVSGERVRYELERTFAEERPEVVLAHTQELGLLAAVHPALGWSSGISEAFEAVRRHHATGRQGWDVEAALMAVMTAGWHEGAVLSLAERLMFPRGWLRSALDVNRLIAMLPQLREPDQRRSEVFAILRPFVPEALAACLGLSSDEAVRGRLRLYIDDLSAVETLCSGSDVLALGVPEGHVVGEALIALRSARLDGLVDTRADELRFIRHWLGGRS